MVRQSENRRQVSVRAALLLYELGCCPKMKTCRKRYVTCYLASVSGLRIRACRAPVTEHGVPYVLRSEKLLDSLNYPVVHSEFRFQRRRTSLGQNRMVATPPPPHGRRRTP